MRILLRYQKIPCVPSAPLPVSICVYVFFVCVCWRGRRPPSPGSAHPAHLSEIGSSPPPLCSPVSHQFISLQYIYPCSSPTLGQIVVSTSGSYDSRPIYFSFLVIQFLCVLHVNLFLLCPRIITCLPVLLLVCLPACQ